MKKIFVSFLIAGALSAIFSGCTKEILVFPPVVEEFDSDKIIDVIAKPSDVRIEGAYDYHFLIKWPKFSDKVSKIVVNYVDNGEAKSKEFTDFSQDGTIETSEFGEYTFKLTTYSKGNLVSAPVSVTAQNKGYVIEEVLEEAVMSPLSGDMEVKLINSKLIPIKMTITYPGSTGNLTKVVNSSEEVIIGTFPLQDGTHNYTVELEDAQGRKTSKSYSYTFEYIVTSSITAGYGSGKLAMSNNANSNIKLKVTYPIAGGGTTTVEQAYTSANVAFDFVPIDGTHQVNVEYEDAAGRKRTESFNYTHHPFAFKIFSTGAAKAGWTVAVSSNATNDGSGPTALLDGVTGTYWHTPWSGEIPPWPHSATITFDKEIQLTKLILQVRHNNGNGSPKDFDLQVSSNGTTFTTHQTYTNTVNTAGAVINFTVNPVATKYVRLLFKNNIANSTSMALGEISFEGNQNL